MSANEASDTGSHDPMAHADDEEEDKLFQEPFQAAPNRLDLRGALQKIWHHDYMAIDSFDGTDRWYLDV